MTQPPPTEASLRKAATRRMVAILALFALLLAGAVALFLREENRRTRQARTQGRRQESCRSREGR